MADRFFYKPGPWCAHYNKSDCSRALCDGSCPAYEPLSCEEICYHAPDCDGGADRLTEDGIWLCQKCYDECLKASPDSEGGNE